MRPGPGLGAPGVHVQPHVLELLAAALAHRLHVPFAQLLGEPLEVVAEADRPQVGAEIGRGYGACFEPGVDVDEPGAQQPRGRLFRPAKCQGPVQPARWSAALALPHKDNPAPTSANRWFQTSSDEGLNNWFAPAPASAQVQFTTGFKRGYPYRPLAGPTRFVAYLCYVRGIARVRISTTVDEELLTSARRARSQLAVSALIDEALAALLARLRAAEIDAAYEAYDRHPLDEGDEWGDLSSFRAAAGSS